MFIHIGQGKWTRHTLACPKTLEVIASYPKVSATFFGHDHNMDNVIIEQGKPYFFCGHFGGSWGKDYLGYRVVEVYEDGNVLTYMCYPEAASKS